VFSDLVKNARREDLGRDTFHSIGFVEVGVALVKVLVIGLEILVDFVPSLSSLSDDVRFEVE
jgi:hypothetical protein